MSKSGADSNLNPRPPAQASSPNLSGPVQSDFSLSPNPQVRLTNSNNSSSRKSPPGIT